jgi:hypothetical protein
MQRLLDKWNQFQSNKKMNKLWSEYKRAAQLEYSTNTSSDIEIRC